jgi:hypothetical protein
MLATYASALLVLAAAAVVGQGVFCLCGRERWSWLAPAAGLAVLIAVAWWAVRLPGEGSSAALVLGGLVAAFALYLPRRVEGLGDAARTGAPVVAAALLLASLPFLAEARFGILGTGLNPDMSQHLFAADRLSESGTERLISSGYPLGPHALVVALESLGPSLVHGFGGLTVAVGVIAAATPLGLLSRVSAPRRIVAALLVGFAYMSASYLTQGAFKETMQALFLLAFAIGLGSLWAGRLGAGPARAVPLAALAAGSAYAYSFPGLVWIGATAVAWGALELALCARGAGYRRAKEMLRRAATPALAALAAFLAAIGPELGRMVDFARFETFDPEGAGLGNLFDRISPLESLGVWPSGDFRVEPGDGFVPAPVFWLGALLALAALGFGLWWWLRREERSVPVALGVSAALVAYAAVAGTPYQEAKAVALAAPLAMLVSIRALVKAAPTYAEAARIMRRRGVAELFPRSARIARVRLGVGALAVSFAAAAGLSTLLTLANGPVGPARWTAGLLERKPFPGATLVLGPEEFLVDEHGRDFIVWELRGGEVCVEADPGPADSPAPPGITQVVVHGDSATPPFAGTAPAADVGDFTLWRVTDPRRGESGCPFVADGDRADPSE